MKRYGMKKKRLLCIIIYFSFIMTGCQQKQDFVDVGFSACEDITSRSVAVISDIQDLVVESGRTIEVRCAENSLKQQEEDVRSLIEKHPKYLLISPVQSLGLENVLNEAKAAGIKVIIVDRNMEHSVYQDYLTQISSDAYNEGKLCAKILAEYFGNKSARILEIQGIPGSSLTNDRARGFRDELCNYENIEIAKVISGYFDRVEASYNVKAYLNGGGTMDAVFGHSDEEGLGALMVLDDLEQKKEIPIVSINGQQEIYEALLSESYYATIYDTPKIGKYIIDVIEDYEAGKNIEKNITVPVAIYNKNNVSKLQEY